MTNVMLDPLSSLLESAVSRLSWSSPTAKEKLELEPTTNDAKVELSFLASPSSNEKKPCSDTSTVKEVTKDEINNITTKKRRSKRDRRATTGGQQELPWMTSPHPWLFTATSTTTTLSTTNSNLTATTEMANKKKERQQRRSLHLRQQSKRLSSPAWRRASLPAYLEPPKALVLAEEHLENEDNNSPSPRAYLSYFDLKRKKQQDEEGVLFSATHASRRASVKWQEKVERLRKQQEAEEHEKKNKALENEEASEPEDSFYERISHGIITTTTNERISDPSTITMLQEKSFYERITDRKIMGGIDAILSPDSSSERKTTDDRENAKVERNAHDIPQSVRRRSTKVRGQQKKKQEDNNKSKLRIALRADKQNVEANVNAKKRRSQKKTEQKVQEYVPALRELIEAEKVRRASEAGPMKNEPARKHRLEARSASLPEHLLRPESVPALKELVEYETKRRSRLTGGTSGKQKKKQSRRKSVGRKARSSSVPASKHSAISKQQRRSLNANWRSEAPDFRWEIPGYQAMAQKAGSTQEPWAVGFGMSTPKKKFTSNLSQGSHNRALHSHRTIPLETTEKARPSGLSQQDAIRNDSAGHHSDSSSDGGTRHTRDIVLTPRDRVATRPWLSLVNLDQVVSYCVETRPQISLDDLYQVVSIKPSASSDAVESDTNELETGSEISNAAKESEKSKAEYAVVATKPNKPAKRRTTPPAIVDSASDRNPKPQRPSKNLQFVPEQYIVMPDPAAWSRRRKLEREIEIESFAIKSRRSSTATSLREFEEESDGIRTRRNSTNAVIQNSLQTSVLALRTSVVNAAASDNAAKQARLQRKLSRRASAPSMTASKNEALSNMDGLSQSLKDWETPVGAFDFSRRKEFDLDLPYVVMSFSDEDL